MIIRNLLAATSIGVFAFFNAQQITYFDENWEPTTKDKMVYYREATKQGNLTLIKDYYATGVLQMQGTAVDPTVNNEVWDGLVTWYYASGKKQNSVTYKNGDPIGPSMTYDEKGRLTSDLVYTGEGKYSGKMLMYEDADAPDSYNGLTEYKNGEPFKEIVYGNSKTGIRYEVDYKNGYYNNTAKYYDANGKLIGTADYKDGSTKGTVVEYYRLPMQVLSVKKMNKEGSELTEQKIYYRNGTVAQELVRKNKSGFDKTYDQTGKLIGTITYRYEDEIANYTPYEGKMINFSYLTTEISHEYNYKNGIMVSERYYNDISRKLEIENFYEGEDGTLSKTIYYDPVMGTKRGELLHKDGRADNGQLFSDYSIYTYKDGKIIKMTNFNEAKEVISEGELSKDGKTFNAKVYGANKEIVTTYAADISSDSFDANVAQYEKGKVVRTAKIKNSTFVEGKLVITQPYSQAKTEYERKGDWRYVRSYNENGVLEEEVKKRFEEDAFESDTFFMSDDVLLNRYYY